MSNISNCRISDMIFQEEWSRQPIIFFVQLENFLVWFLKQVYWRWPKQKYEIRYKLNLLNHTLLYFVGNEI